MTAQPRAQTYGYLGPWHRGWAAVRLSLAGSSFTGQRVFLRAWSICSPGWGRGGGAWSLIPESPRLMDGGRGPGREAEEHSGWACWLEFGFGQFET